MTTFFCSDNNGVTAVISEEHAKLFRALVDAKCEHPALGGVRVFTFCHPDRLERTPSAKHIYTGTYTLLRELFEHGNHTLKQNAGHDWSGYVPFSNGLEHGNPEGAAKKELLYRTTVQDVIDVFGMSTVIADAA